MEPLLHPQADTQHPICQPSSTPVCDCRGASSTSTTWFSARARKSSRTGATRRSRAGGRDRAGSAPADVLRRRETLAVYIASISDVDDIVPMLTAFQIEWNKMHTLIGLQAGSRGRALRSRRGRRVVAGAQGRDPRVARSSPQGLASFASDLGRRLSQTAVPQSADRRKRMSVGLLAGSHIGLPARNAVMVGSGQPARDFDLSERPIYFVSSNTHSLVNMVTGFAQATKIA